MSTAPARLLMLALPALLGACGPSRLLEGSVSAVLNLAYESVEARADDKEISVRFLSPQGAGQDTVIQVTARLQGTVLEPGTPLDLAERLQPTDPPRGTISRSVLDEPVRPFPPIARGSLTLEALLEPGATVRGSFHTTFANGTDVYSGRTLFGRFEAQVPNPEVSNP